MGGNTHTKKRRKINMFLVAEWNADQLCQCCNLMGKKSHVLGHRSLSSQEILPGPLGQPVFYHIDKSNEVVSDDSGSA